ncbi:MAG: DUF4012 domain-containing protein [Candidatus Shapirobacteria bacterium]
MITAQISQQQKPVALIVGRSSFVGYFLKEALVKLHCQTVLVEPKELVKLELERFDYCFYLPENFSKSLLISLANLTQKFSGKLLIGTENFFGKEEFEELKRQPKLDYRWVAWQDVYGPKMSLEGRGFISRLIKRAVGGGVVVMAKTGATQIYPLFVADLIYQLTKLIFSPRTKKRAYLVTSTSMSCLSATLEAQRLVNSRIKMSFTGKERGERLGEEELERMPVKTPTEWREGVRITVEYFRRFQSGKVSKRQSEGKTVEVKRRQERNKGGWRVFLAVGLLLLGGVFFYPAGQCYYHLRQIEIAFRSGNFGQAFKVAGRAESSCRKVERISGKIRAGRELAGLLDENKKVYEQVKRLGQLIFQEKNLGEKKRLGEMEELVIALKPRLKNLYEDLSLFDEVGVLPTDLGDNLGSARRLVLELSRTIEYLPEMTGGEQNKSYLVLLQNNNELRPTGGFIGSLAVVTFSKGQLVDFEVRDVYALDGQLKGHVEPPPELKKYLGEANWYLRDVNWEPDFPAVGAKAAWFLEKETGRPVDGVVGFNLAAAQKIMDVLGEVGVNDFGEKITAQNLFERAEYHSEINFFPGSTQKQDFLGGLARAMFDRMMRLESKGVLALLGGFYQSLQEKEVLLYVNQPQVQAALINLNWHGGWRSFQCLEAASYDCLSDYLMVVEANVGVNKANYFVKRETELAVKMEEGELKSQVTLAYQNESPAEVFPGGNYKNYLRLVLPTGVRVQKVTVEGQEVDQALIYQSEVKDKWVVGFPVEVPIKQKRQVQVEYSREITSDSKKPRQYLLLVQKQSGAKEEVFNLRLTPGTGLVGFQFKPEVRAEKGSYLWLAPWNQDLSFEAYLTK